MTKLNEKINVKHLKNLRKISKANGWQLLSDKWSGSSSKYDFEFPDGQRYRATADSVRTNGFPKNRLDDLHKIAKDNNCKLLSTKWLGSTSKYDFELPDGRLYSASANAVKNNGFPKDRLDDLRKIAKDNNCKLLSTKWLGGKAKYEFELPDGQVFKRSPGEIKRSGWTKDQIIGNTDSGVFFLEELRTIAEAHGGKLLSTKWLGAKSKYEFEFDDGYTFTRAAELLKNKGWPTNYLAELRKIAEDNGGKLLSTKWIGNKKQYDFEFDDGTQFSAPAHNLKVRGWPKDKDVHLRMSGPNRKTILLAELRKIAKDNGGELVSTKWLGSNVPHEFKFQNGTTFFIRPDGLKRQGWPKNQDAFLRLSTSNPNRKSLLMQDLIKIAEANNGKVLTPEWLGAQVPHKLEFEDGTEFTISSSNLKSRGWPKDQDRYMKRSKP